MPKIRLEILLHSNLLSFSDRPYDCLTWLNGEHSPQVLTSTFLLVECLIHIADQLRDMYWAIQPSVKFEGYIIEWKNMGKATGLKQVVIQKYYFSIGYLEYLVRYFNVYSIITR